MKLLSKFSQRERVILYTLVLIISAGLLYGFLIEPQVTRWNNVSLRIVQTKLKLQKSLSLIKKRSEIESEYNKYANKLQLKGSNEKEIASILNELEVIARNSGVGIVSIRPKPVRDKRYYRQFVIEIESESSMHSLMKFIYETKNSPQLIKIDKLNLNTKSSQQGTIIRSSMVISKIALL